MKALFQFSMKMFSFHCIALSLSICLCLPLALLYYCSCFLFCMAGLAFENPFDPLLGGGGAGSWWFWPRNSTATVDSPRLQENSSQGPLPAGTQVSHWEADSLGGECSCLFLILFAFWTMALEAWKIQNSGQYNTVLYSVLSSLTPCPSYLPATNSVAFS